MKTKKFSFYYFRGRGPLRTTMDVINAAKMISECGSKLNKIAKDIAAQVNDFGKQEFRRTDFGSRLLAAEGEGGKWQ